MRIAFFSATLLASSLAVAATPIDGWYGSLFGGYSYLPDNISRTLNGTVFNHGSYNSGYNAGGRLGFQGHPMRYEGEFTYLDANVKSFRSNRIENRIHPRRLRHTGGHSIAALGMANIYYDFPEMVPCIAPYVGVGLGYGWIDVTLNNQQVFTFNNQLFFNRIHFQTSSSVFAYQATAGFTYNFAENYALNIAYRYLGTTRVSNLGKIFRANIASVGVVYRFNEYNYK